MSNQPLRDPAHSLNMETDQDMPTSAEPAVSQEQLYRAAAYSIIAALLRDVPSEETLAHITAFENVGIDEDEMLLAMSSLGLAATAVDREAIKVEYQNLFIGVGRGELLPYGSYYLTGFLNEKPLAKLRNDMNGLGIARRAAVSEPEDHIAALCEMMCGLILGDFGEPLDLEGQRKFFNAHLGSWASHFFGDLEQARTSKLYGAVGSVGKAFIAIEVAAFEMLGT